MDAKEEMLEEIEEILPDNNSIDVEEVPVDKQETIADDIIEYNSSVTDNEVDNLLIEEQKQEEIELPVKKNKTPLIVLLSILLVLDIAALVIYIIGIEKVISFIK